MFGERGFEAASTRDIAASAGVSAPALQYYFDNKEGVYLACVEYLAERVREYMSAAIEGAEHAVAENKSDAELIDAYCKVQESQALMLAADKTGDWRLFMARLQSGEGPAAGTQWIHQHIGSRVTKALSTIVGRMLGRSAEDEETLLRTIMLNGQMHVFHLARQSLLAKLNWDTIDASRLALLQRIIRGHVSALLRSMAEARDCE
jgi:AcrR family transcriptional regulator